ncbi:hypothetical protein AAHC03_024294 [Spirometra sp. Aus1]
MTSRICFNVFLGVVCICHLAIGLVGIVVGTIANAPAQSFGLSDTPLSIQRMMIGLGVLLVLLAILAGASLFCRSRVPFLTFLVLSTLTAIVHIGLGLYILIFGGHVTEFFSSPHTDQLFIDPAVMNMLQSTLECCGMYSVDYYSSLLDLPESCCPGNTGFCDVSDAYSVGCAEKILDIISPVFKGLGGFLVLLCIVQLVLVIVLYVISPRIEKVTDIKEFSYS